MEETGLENELLASNEALPYEEVRTYSFYAGDENIDGSSGAGYLDNQEGLIENATEDDLRAYWDTAENLQDQFGGDWDKYMAYMNERQDLIDSGEYEVGDYGQIVETSAVQNVDGTMIEPSDIQNLSRNDFIAKYGLDPSEVQLVETDTTGARAQGFTEWSNSDAVVALNEKYGIDSTRVTEEGREYQWNGSAYVKTKDYDNFDFGSLAKLVVKAAASAIVTPAIGGALTSALTNAGLSSSLASAASSAIINSATQLITTGELDVSQALLSAAGSYFQEAGMGELIGDSQVGQALTDATTFVQEKVSNFQDLISTGSSIADAAIQAGGMNMLTSMVTQGEVNLESALASAIQGGVQAGYQELVAASGITSEDEFEDWMSEQDELQQAAIDADVKDPFLNPNYVTIGDGLMQNADGEVFNYDGDNVGNMSDLDVDGDGVLNANDLEFVEATGEYRAIPQVVQDALNPIDETPALQLQDGNTYYLDADGNVYSSDQVEWRGGDTNDYVVIGTDTVAGTTATYSQGSDVFYDDDMKIVLRGEDAGIINIGTGNEFTYGEQYSGNQIFDDPTGIPSDLGAAQYSGTVRGAPGNPGAEFDVYYNPETNTTYLVNQADPTQVNKIENTTPEEVQEQTPDNPSDPVDNPDDNLTGGNSGVGDDGAANENEYVEDTNVNDSTVVDLNNQLINDNSTDDNTASQNPNDSTDNSTENQEENQEEVTEEVTDTGEVVDSNGEVATNTGATANQGNRANQILGLLGSSMASASGQNGETTSTGTEENTEVDGTGNVTDETTIGDDTPGDGGTDSTETGPGDDKTGTGDPGIDDGTGGTGPGGDGNGGGGLLSGGGNFTPKWGELFKYTDITPAQAKKMAPMYDYIKQTKGMLS